MDEDEGPWYAGRVRCRDCGHEGIAVWPAACDESAMECGSCGLMTTFVVSLLLNEEYARRIQPGGCG